MKLQRESNMELLRIVAILMITLHHFLIDKYRGGIVYGNEFLDGWQWAVMLNGFVYIGVNVFVLISGYFGIKFKWKGVMNLFIFCAFYMALNLLQQDFIGYEQYTSTEILFKSLKALKNTSKWFIPCYLALYFISPFLNTARDSLSKHQYICALIVLSVYCLWFGYIRQSNVFNHNGYTVGQFIWLYFIGGYIRRFNVIQSVRKCRMVCVSIWLILSLLRGVATIALYSGYPLLVWHPITYNNPFTLIASIAFFCLFTTFHFKSKAINYIAQSVLAVYLLHLSIPPFSKWHVAINMLNGPCYFLFAIIWTFVRFIVTIGVDQVRLVLMIPVNWLWNKGEKIVNRKLKLYNHE